MLVKCTKIADGPGPSEAVVSIVTVDGPSEEVALSSRHFQNGTINVGAPLNAQKGQYLIELPRESASGRWRIWIPESEVVSDRMLQSA
jgi:hypothetical protein